MDAEVGGRKLLMLVDTGAASVVLDRAVTQRLGLPLKPAPYPAGGLGSSNVESQIARLETIRIGAYDSAPVDAWVMDLGTVNASRVHHGNRPVDGILGANFLDFHLAVIDYPSRALYLKPPGRGQVVEFPGAKASR